MWLGIPAGVDTPLGRRLAGLTFFRLTVLTIFLVIIERYYLTEMVFGGFSSLVAVTTASTAFLASAGYTVLLRRGQQLATIAHAQLITDQLVWTAIVYISGGVTSGAASLYGLTCLSGAITLGTPGAISAAAAAMSSYLVLCLGFAYGFVPIPNDQPVGLYVTTADQMIYPAFSTLMAILVATVLAAYLSERLRAFGGRLEIVTQRAERAERLAALGRLAAGLAHEIRNPLGSIRGSIELLRTGGSLSDDDQHLCRIIEREAMRLNDLVGDMVDLSRPRQPEKRQMDLGTVAQAVVQLAQQSSRGGNIEVRYEGPESLLVDADPGQLHQILWNLVRNAIQASKAGDEVKVQLSTTDDEVMMRVIDHGAGIPAEKHDEIFEAFFTTRSHGVGIGLAVVTQLTKAHDFQLDFDSAEGEGTTFSVRMPKAAALAISIVLVGFLSVGCQAPASHERAHHPDNAVGWWAASGSENSSAMQPGAGATSGILQSRAVRSADARQAESPATTSNSAKSSVSIRIHAQPPPAGGSFRNTYYDFPEESPKPETGPIRKVFDRNCKPLRTVTRAFHDAVCVQGSGRLHTGETISFARRNCACAALCPRTNQQICFDMLDKRRFPYGRGAAGTAITPLRSVAVDSDVIPLGKVLYIPAYQGLRDATGRAHDGCFIAEDRGLKVRGKHVDIFTGSPSQTRVWNAAVPSNRGVRVMIDASRCAYLRQQ